MENKNTQTTKVFVGQQKRISPKKKNDSFIRRIIITVIGGLLVLWIWSKFSEPSPNSNQEQMKKDREILEKEKG